MQNFFTHVTFRHIRHFSHPRNTVFKFNFGAYGRNSPICYSSIGEQKISSKSISKQQIVEQNKFNLKLLRNTLNSVDFKNIPIEDGKLLLRCCGSSTADLSRESRNKLCQTIFGNLVNHDRLDLCIYHSYIKTCTENGVSLDCRDILASLKCQPDEKIHKLLLENVCERGAIEEAFVLLEAIKNKGYSVDEAVFTSLVLAHTIKGGLKAAESVLLTMRTAQVPETINTKLALLRGILRRRDYDDFKKFLERYPLNLTENQLLVVLEELSLNGDISWLKEMNTMYDTVSREFINHLRNICIHLVHMDKPKDAMKILEYFVSSSTEDNYGNFILEEMLLCNSGIDEIISLSEYLRNNGMNQFVFERLTGFALNNQYVDAAWSLLEHLGELRPHYFWPLLVIARNTNGERGILEVIEKMSKMNVKPNSETLEQYVLPFCNLEDSKVLVQKLVHLGFSVKGILSSVLLVLLQYGNIKEAVRLCDFYKIDIGGEKLFGFISTSWNQTRDSQSTVTILQKYCESHRVENDLVGDFLIKSLSFCRNSEDFKNFSELLMLLKEKKLKITSSSAEILRNTPITCESDILNDIQKRIDDLLEFRTKPESSYIPHPRDMTLEELECHFLELQEKNMETRGVLRRLIQMHSRLGNCQRAEQLRQTFSQAGYVETLGMKSSIMHSYINGGHLEPALDAYRDIKKLDCRFTVDSFKIIDLATLLVRADKFEEAMEIMQSESEFRVQGGPAIQRNCLELLRAFKDDQKQSVMFKFLIDKGYCKLNNINMGPLVRIHLNNGNLESAASAYIELSKKHRCTPLQLEVIREIVKTENEKLLQEVLNATIAIHGYESTQAVLISALAEEGKEGALIKLFSKNKRSIKNALEKRCEWWVREGKLEALKTLVKCCERLPMEVFDTNFIYICMMKIYSANNDCESAVHFYEQLLERDLPLPTELEDLLRKLLKYNNFKIPKTLGIKSE